MKDKILFVDDEVFFARPYVTELESKFEVSLWENSEGVVAELKANVDYCAAVIDVMMPPPNGMTAVTLEGMDTGLWILRECRDVLIARKTPVVVLTNRSAPYVKETLSNMNFTPGLIVIHSKIETPKFYLPHLVEQLVSAWRQR